MRALTVRRGEKVVVLTKQDREDVRAALTLALAGGLKIGTPVEPWEQIANAQRAAWERVRRALK